MIERIRGRLVRHVDRYRIKAAIEAAEAHTTGKIHVALAPHFWGDLRRTAERAFARLRVAQTPHRNGVLFFVVPSRREFVVLGDRGIHEKVGQEFWHSVVSAVREKFKPDDLTGGLVHGIELAGDELARHFPRKSGD